MSDILSEIDNALFQERMEQLWRKYGKLIIAALVGVVVLTAAVSAYKEWKDSSARENTGAVISALESENPVQALQDFAKNSEGVHWAIARINAAHLLSQDGRGKESLALLEEVTKSSRVPPTFREYAALSTLYLSFDQFTDNPKAAQTGLDQALTLMNKADSPWRFHARLMAGLIQGQALKDFSTGVETLGPLLAEGAPIPESLRNRARSVSHVFALERENSLSGKPAVSNTDG